MLCVAVCTGMHNTKLPIYPALQWVPDLFMLRCWWSRLMLEGEIIPLGLVTCRMEVLTVHGALGQATYEVCIGLSALEHDRPARSEPCWCGRDSRRRRFSEQIWTLRLSLYYFLTTSLRCPTATAVQPQASTNITTANKWICYISLNIECKSFLFL